MKYFLLAVTLFFSIEESSAQKFEDYFVDKALRIDYIFSGNDESQVVALDQLNQLPHWAGRRHNLSQLLRKGNGQIWVTDVKTGTCIYTDAFSTLFSEWQTTPEAKEVRKSFENSFLIPYPKGKIAVEIKLRDKFGVYRTAIRHDVNPDDILIKKKGLKNIPAYTAVHQGDSVNKCVNVVILAEGYTASEMAKFREHAQIACEQILNHSPFNKLKDKFNFYAVETISEDSGVSVPRESKWSRTAFSSHFDTFYSDRYLTTSHVKDIHDAIAGIPYAHIIILANTDVYGGGGIFNAYTLTTTGHAAFKPVVVHEFGHSFAGLADEYFYDSDVLDNTYLHSVEPWEPNITTLVDFTVKWQDMLVSQTPVPTNVNLADKYSIGVFEGAGYSAKGIYRPAIDCRMKTNTCKDFCPVCQRAILQLVKFYTE
ncbi:MULTISPECIES: M64 family metallopeptidase [unclassified Dysgonomonas]|uniref:M64 family metallopeptidase n=1 Tax=unclassified Dysgonomonas TaxID=2630389 RepID=UPI0025C12C4D|nr:MULTISPECIES: M64 family metallopeptidase [unclassified Dysgonomonas]HMM04938.1 M64 family metallopeptidase [Dysgonomonas sp.]